jgi:hypothetical protein
MGWPIGGLNPCWGKRFFSCPECPDGLWSPTSLPFSGYQGYFCVCVCVGGGAGAIKWLGHEVDHSPPPSAEVKNEWRYASAYLICLYDIDRDNFAFAFLSGYTSQLSVNIVTRPNIRILKCTGNIWGMTVQTALCY